MKKIFALALSLVLVLAMFTLTGCGSPLDGDDAAAALSYIQEETNKLSSFKADMAVTTTMPFGTTMTQNSTVYWTKDGDSANSRTVMDGTEVITIGKTAYTKVTYGDEEYKIKSTEDEVEGSPMGDFLSSAVNAEFVSRENGVYKIKTGMNQAGIDEILGDEMLETLGADVDVSVSMVVICGSDGVVDNIEITADVTSSIEGNPVSVSVTVSLTLSELNSVAKIEAPADADEYLDASAE